MKYFNKLLLVFIGCLGLSLSTLQAQELRYTLYDMSPLVTNPANTGAFLGTVRLSGIIRSQWGNAYSMPSFSADSPIIAVGKKKRDWLGVGIMTLNDVAGQYKLTRTHSVLSAAYHKVLDKKSANVLTFGLQYSSVSAAIIDPSPELMQLDFAPLTPQMVDFIFNPAAYPTQPQFDEFTQQFLNPSTSGGPGGQNTGMGVLGLLNSAQRLPANTSTRFNFGVRLASKLNDDAKLVVGAAVHNPFRFNLNLGGNQGQGGGQSRNTQGFSSTSAPSNSMGSDTSGYKFPTDLRFHATLDYDITEKLRLRPSAFVHSLGAFREIILQTNVGYYVTEDKRTVLNGGLGYRFGEAIQFLASLEYNDWVIAGGYDYNANALGDTAGRYRSGFEVAFSYIIKIYQEPKVSPAILCPKL